jgi:ribose transport system substrate-binding protein
VTPAVTRRNVSLLLVNDTNEYQQAVRRDAEEAARHAGVALDVHAAGNDFVQQIRQLYECLRREPAERPRLVFLFPVRDGSLEYALRDIARAGVGCAILNRRPKYLDALRREFPDVPFGSIGPDQAEIGRLQARQAAVLLPAGGFVLHVMGPSLSSAAQDRLDGFREELRGGPITHSVIHGDWDQARAQEAVLKWLRVVLVGSYRVDLVACQNDAMAMGAKAALELAAGEMRRPELRRVPITGVDGRADVGQKLVIQGALAATVIQMSSGGPAVEWATRLFEGHASEPDVVLPVSAFPALARPIALSA